MKNVNIYLEDADHEKAMEMKEELGLSWRDFLLRKDLQKKGEENERRGIHNCE